MLPRARASTIQRIHSVPDKLAGKIAISKACDCEEKRELTTDVDLYSVCMFFYNNVKVLLYCMDLTTKGLWLLDRANKVLYFLPHIHPTEDATISTIIC